MSARVICRHGCGLGRFISWALLDTASSSSGSSSRYGLYAARARASRYMLQYLLLHLDQMSQAN